MDSNSAIHKYEFTSLFINKKKTRRKQVGISVNMNVNKLCSYADCKALNCNTKKLELKIIPNFLQVNVSIEAN